MSATWHWRNCVMPPNLDHATAPSHMKSSLHLFWRAGPWLLGVAACVAVTGATLAQTASDPDPAASSPDSGSGPSLFQSIGSFLSNLGTPKVSAGISSNDAPKGDGAGGLGLNIVAIDSWSKTSSLVLDPQCNTPVQPFDFADNAASLALLAGKVKLQGLVEGLDKGGKASLKPTDVVKIAARSLNWMPMALERQIGESLVPEADIVDEQKNKDTKRTYEQARAMLNDILQALPPSLPYEFRVLVRNTSYGNASALPGGILLVDRDLFKKGSDPDYAYFVMSHEVAHVLQRHQTRAYQAKLVDGIDSIENLGRLIQNAGKKDPMAVLSYASALKKLFVSFSEQQELQADSCAIRLMGKRIPNPVLLEAKLRRIEQRFGPIVAIKEDGPEGRTLVDQVKYLTDGIHERHPNTAQRRGNIQITLNFARNSP